MTVDEHLAHIDNRLDAVTTVVHALAGSHGRTQELLSGLTESMTRYVDAADARMQRIENNMDRLEGNMERLEGNVARLEGNMEQMQKNLDDLIRAITSEHGNGKGLN
jgi:predicted nuclease with TOPRIM domain